MKKILSLFLSLVLISSMILGTFTVSVFAEEVTGGTFSVDGKKVKQFLIDFNDYDNKYWTNVTYTTGSTFDPAQIFKVKTRAEGQTSKGMLTEILTKSENPSDKYMKLRDDAGDGLYFQRLYFNTGATRISEDETMHLSIDIKANDSNYRKIFGFARHHNATITYINHVLEFTSDGNLKFFAKSTDITYDTDWHRYDFLCTTTGVKCYIDGVLKKEYSEVNINSFLYNSSKEYSYNAFGFMFAPVNDSGKQIYTSDVVDTSLCFDNLKAAVYNNSNIVSSIPSITSIGSDGDLVAYDAKEIEFTMDAEVPVLKEEYFTITAVGSDESQKIAKSYGVSYNGNGEYKVKVQLKDDCELISYTKYTLQIDPACFSDGKYELGSNGIPYDVRPISRDFSVTPAPFSLKTPDFTEEGDSLKAETSYVNTVESVNVIFLLVAKDSEGMVVAIDKETYTGLTATTGLPVELEVSDSNIASAELIVLDADTLKPIFIPGRYNENDYEQETNLANAGEIYIDELNVETKKFDVHLNVDSAASVDGILAIYKKDADKIATLIYADYVTTAADGTLKKTITLSPETIAAGGEYTVAFYAEGVNVKPADFRFIYEESVNKPTIISIDSDGFVEPNQNTFSFTLSSLMPELKPEHIWVVKSDGSDEVIKATSLVQTSDAAGACVEVVLEKDFDSWTKYKLVIGKECYKDYQSDRYTNFVIDVTDIVKSFETPHDLFDLKKPEFEKSDSDVLSVETIIVNATSDGQDACFILVNKDANGIVKSIDKVYKNNFTTSYDGDKVKVSASGFTEGCTAEFFVVDANNFSPLFDAAYSYNYDQSISQDEIPEAATGVDAGKMALGSFSYQEASIEANINTGLSKAVNGVLYVYKRGETLKDTFIYADSVTTASDGTVKSVIKFPAEITNVSGEYTVAFCAENNNFTKDFVVYEKSIAFGGNIVKAQFDAAGLKYEDYYLKVTADVIEGSLGVGFTSTTFDENAMNFNFTRSDKEDSYRIVIKPAAGKQTKGVHTVKYKFYADKAKEDGTIDWKGGKGTITMNRVSSDNIDGSFDISSLLANKWYDIELTFDIDGTQKSYIKVTDLATGNVVIEDSLAIKGTNGFTNMWMYTTYTTDSTVSNKLLFKDYQVMSDYGDQKAVIRYLGDEDVVDYDQNVVEFKISKNNGLTAENIYVKDNLGNVIKAKSISVTEDMGEYIITATLEKNLSSNKSYTLNVDPVGYEDYRELINGEYVAVAPLTRDFETDPAPIDIDEPEITNDGSNVTVKSVIFNSTGSSVDATAILAVVSSDGIMQSVTKDYKVVKSTKEETFTNTNAFAAGNSAEYFIIKSLNNPVPLLGKTWSINYDGSIPAPEIIVATTKAAAKTIVLNEFEYNTNFDHIGKKIVVNLNTGAKAPVDGVLYVYSGDSLAADNIIYANYVTVSADGTLLKEIKFDSSIVNTTKKYTVAFYSNSVDGVIKNTFDVYDDNAYREHKQNNILENVKKASTFSAIKQVITGTDDLGKVVCDAWTIFSKDANVTVYKSLKNKEAVFISLVSSAKSLTSYGELCTKFAEFAEAQQKKEDTPAASAPSSNNKNTGSPSVSMSVTPSASQPVGSTAVSGNSVFTDMSGHWGQKYAEALVAKGIINGYNDGSFRGDNAITRAELTKIIVEALDVPTAQGKAFGDVNSSSWYASYVSRAATAGVVNGFEDGSFGPDKNVSRQDAVLMIYRAMNLITELPEGYKFFADEKDIQDYASMAIRTLGDLGIITGNGKKNEFLPNNDITRAEMAAVVCRALDYLESHIQ